jgi:hypothetical protein
MEILLEELCFGRFVVRRFSELPQGKEARSFSIAPLLLKPTFTAQSNI